MVVNDEANGSVKPRSRRTRPPAVRPFFRFNHFLPTFLRSEKTRLVVLTAVVTTVLNALVYVVFVTPVSTVVSEIAKEGTEYFFKKHNLFDLKPEITHRSVEAPNLLMPQTRGALKSIFDNEASFENDDEHDGVNVEFTIEAPNDSCTLQKFEPRTSPEGLLPLMHVNESKTEAVRDTRFWHIDFFPKNVKLTARYRTSCTIYLPISSLQIRMLERRGFPKQLSKPTSELMRGAAYQAVEDRTASMQSNFYVYSDADSGLNHALSSRTILIRAADCDAIIRQGVFNVTTVNKGLHIQDDLISWLSITTDEQFISAQKAGLNFSATIDSIPFNLNGSDSLNEFHRLQTALNQGQVRHFTQDEFLQTVQLSVAPEIVNAWLKCVTQPAVGLSCSISANNDHLLTFEARWLPNSITDYPPTVLPGGFQVSPGATFTGTGFADGSEIQMAGSSVILNRPGSDAVTILLNTSKGSCQENIAALQPPPPPVLQSPPLELKRFTAQGAADHWPVVQLQVPSGYKIISGGAVDHYPHWGNMLTCSYTTDGRTWIAKGKDHGVSEPAPIEADVIALFDPNDLWDVTYQSAIVGPAEHPAGTVSLPPGYTLTGGGACANWSTAGSFLTASYPHDSATWFAESKDHYAPEAVTLTIIVIGIRPRNLVSMPDVRIFSSTSAVADIPSTSVAVDSSYLMLGGGCQVLWTEPGNLLTACLPTDLATWSAASKDHMVASPARIVAYAIGIKPLPPAACTYAFSPNAMLSLPPQASTVTLNLVTSAGCTWGIDSAPLWASILSAGPLTASGTISVSFKDNLAGSQRTGTITAGGQTLVVIQEGLACGPFKLDQTVMSFSSTGDRGSVSVVGQDGCPWTISNLPTWITPLSGSSGVGPGTFTFQVAPLQAQTRSATFLVAGLSITVTQNGIQPDFSIGPPVGAPTSASVSAGQDTTYSQDMIPAGGFLGQITLTCAGAPRQATCVPSSPLLTVQDSSTLLFTLHVTTTKGSLSPPSTIRWSRPKIRLWMGPFCLAIFLLIAIDLIRGTRRPKFIPAWATIVVLLTCLGFFTAACGRSSNDRTPPAITGTPPGNYGLTVTAKSGNISHTSTVTLIVN